MKKTQLVNINTLSPAELEQRLRIFAKRANALCGHTLVKDPHTGQMTPQPIGAVTSAFFERMAKGLNDPETTRQRNEFMARAQNDPVARDQLCAMRVETFNNYILANSMFVSMFYRVVTLANDEEAWHENVTGNEVNVYYVAQDGRPKTMKITRDETRVKIPLKKLTTYVVRYKVLDIDSGNVVDQALQTLRLAYDMTNKIEADAFTLLDGSIFGSFSLTGTRQNRVYVANSRIKSGNLPTTNELSIASVGAATKFGYTSFDEVINYCNCWGNNAFVDGSLQPTGRVLVPSAHARELASGITPSGSTSNSVADRLLEQGWSGCHYMGYDWVVIPDATLDPAVKKAYPELNKKPCILYLKPGMDGEETWNNTKELRQANEEEREMWKVAGFATNATLKPFACRVAYRT